MKNLIHARFSRLAALVVLGVGCLSVSQLSAQTRHALVFAPQTYESLPAAPHFGLSTQALHYQLTRCGFAEDNIKLLTDKNATQAKLQEAIDEALLSIAPGDVWVVILNSYGFQQDEIDHIATFKTGLDDKGGIVGESIALQELLSSLAEISDTNQCVIIDGNGDFSGPQAEPAARFARSLPSPNDGQVVIAGRDQKRLRRYEREMSAFAWSVFDGLDGHADTNRDGQVSALELSEYCRTFAEDARVRLPRIAGKTADAVAIFRLDGSMKIRNADVFNQQSRQLLNEAVQALHLELDARAAINLLDRARRLCRDQELLELIDDYRLTARVLFEGFDEAVKDWPKRGRTWYFIAAKQPTEASLGGAWVSYFEPGSSEPKFSLPTGTVIGIAKRNGNWLQVESVQRPVVVDGTLTFEDVDVQLPGYVKVGDFQEASAAVVPSDYLRIQLEKTRNPSTASTGS